MYRTQGELDFAKKILSLLFSKYNSETFKCISWKSDFLISVSD